MKERKILKAGMGEFFVKNVFTRDKEGELLRTKSSNDVKISVLCEVTDRAGESEGVWVTFTQTWMKFLVDLMDAVGIPKHYGLVQAFEDPTILVGRGGDCLIEVETSDQYGTQNRLKFIKKLNTDSKAATNKVVNDFFEDSIPF